MEIEYGLKDKSACHRGNNIEDMKELQKPLR